MAAMKTQTHLLFGYSSALALDYITSEGSDASHLDHSSAPAHVLGGKQESGHSGFKAFGAQSSFLLLFGSPRLGPLESSALMTLGQR